jgi:hypothetical protein
MTLPQDPNQPGWGAPPPTSQPGWGAPPPSPAPQPGWGPPPGAQPGWGAPPPGYQPAPGWGAPMPPKKKGHGCLIAFIIVLIVVLLGVGGCVAACSVLVMPYVQTTTKIQDDLGGPTKATVTFESVNGQTHWVITLNSTSPYSASAAACQIVVPDLKNSQFKNDHFTVQDSHGNEATDATPCP